MDDSPNQDASNQENLEVTQPLEGAASKYLREFRLLNSLLLSLFLMIFLFGFLWNIVVWVAPAGETASDFADAGTPSSAPKKQEQKVRLMQRQKSAKPARSFKQGANGCLSRFPPNTGIRFRPKGLGSQKVIFGRTAFFHFARFRHQQSFYG